MSDKTDDANEPDFYDSFLVKLNKPCPYCGERVEDDEDDFRRHLGEEGAHSKGFEDGKNVAADSLFVLSRIRQLAAASTTPSERESMPPELEALLFPGTDRLPYASRTLATTESESPK